MTTQTTNSAYRPSGRRKGSPLTGREVIARWVRQREVFRIRLKAMRLAYRCSAEDCLATMASLRFDYVMAETVTPARNEHERDLVATGKQLVAIILCERGHEQQMILRDAYQSPEDQ